MWIGLPALLHRPVSATSTPDRDRWHAARSTSQDDLRDADLVLDTTGVDPAESVVEVLKALRAGGWLPDEQA
jgi:cytidylate kinase